MIDIFHAQRNQEFLSKLRDDILQTRQRRFQYQITKVTSLSSFVGIGSLLVKGVALTSFLYVIPFLAIAFDFFILGETFTLKRMANFLEIYQESSRNLEFKWEVFVKKNPDRLSSIANFIISLASFSGCFLVLFSSEPNLNWFSNTLNLIWFISLSILLFSLRLVEMLISIKKWRIY